jgi:radical SAM protein with 4Fe4S-binding SPASM domain
MNIEKKDYLLNQSKTFCLAPWVSLYINPSGNVTPCCIYDENYSFGNINSQSLNEIYNKPEVEIVKSNMIDGICINQCSNCYNSEKLNFESYRSRINKKYENIISIIEGDEKMNFHLWDVRITNLCNFKCRMCYHGLSSHWYSDAKKLGMEVSNSSIIELNNPNDFLNQLEPHYEYVEEIYFAGGEPLMMQEHYDILDKLIELNKTDVIIRYSTNFSNLKYKNKHIFDYWKHFKNLELYISVDGVNKIGEYVRKGFKNEIFHNNVNEFLKSEIKPKAFGFAVTFGSLNYLHLFDIVLDFFNNNYINMNEDKLIEKSIFFNPITEPAYYDCSYLPENYKSQFFKRLENFELELLQFNLNEQTINWIIQQLNFVYDFSKSNVFNKEKIEEMIKINNILDVSRNENFYETFDYFSELNNIVCNSI